MDDEIIDGTEPVPDLVIELKIIETEAEEI